MTPKRVSAGYTKDGKKIFKRMFIIEKLNKIEKNYTLDSSTLDTEPSLSESVVTSFSFGLSEPEAISLCVFQNNLIIKD